MSPALGKTDACLGLQTRCGSTAREESTDENERYEKHMGTSARYGASKEPSKQSAYYVSCTTDLKELQKSCYISRVTR